MVTWADNMTQALEVSSGTAFANSTDDSRSAVTAPSATTILSGIEARNSEATTVAVGQLPPSVQFHVSPLILPAAAALSPVNEGGLYGSGGGSSGNSGRSMHGSTLIRHCSIAGTSSSSNRSGGGNVGSSEGSGANRESSSTRDLGGTNHDSHPSAADDNCISDGDVTRNTNAGGGTSTQVADAGNTTGNRSTPSRRSSSSSTTSSPQSLQHYPGTFYSEVDEMLSDEEEKLLVLEGEW